MTEKSPSLPATTATNHGTLLDALSEGAFLMGLERDADVVKMVSYAPLLANVSGRTGWHGMIYFDSLHSYAHRFLLPLETLWPQPA